MRPLILLVGLYFAVVRVLGVLGLFDGLEPIKLQVFKDAAHLFVGGLIGGALMARWVRWYLAAAILAPNANGLYHLHKSFCEYETFLRNLAILLSVVETICAVASRLTR